MLIWRIPLSVTIWLVSSLSINAQGPQSFFPSQIGNLWHYQGSITGMDWRVVRDSIAPNRDKFLFTLGKPFLYRLDTNYNVYERYSNGGENWIYTLDADSGEVWHSGVYYVWVARTFSGVVFGRQSSVKVIRYGPEYLIPCGRSSSMLRGN